MNNYFHPLKETRAQHSATALSPVSAGRILIIQRYFILLQGKSTTADYYFVKENNETNLFVGL